MDAQTYATRVAEQAGVDILGSAERRGSMTRVRVFPLEG
jgi:hypothetical protein